MCTIILIEAHFSVTLNVLLIKFGIWTRKMNLGMTENHAFDTGKDVWNNSIKLERYWKSIGLMLTKTVAADFVLVSPFVLVLKNKFPLLFMSSVFPVIRKLQSENID